MSELIGKFKLMDTCEGTKHRAVGHKSQNMFLRLAKNNMISTSNPSDVGIPKRINLLEIFSSDFKNTILKMDSDTLGKDQNQYSVATILNAAKISYASRIIRLSSA